MIKKITVCFRDYDGHLHFEDATEENVQKLIDRIHSNGSVVVHVDYWD